MSISETILFMGAAFAAGFLLVKLGSMKLLHYILLLLAGFMGWVVVVMVIAGIVEVCIQGSMNVEENFILTVAYWWPSWIYMFAYSFFAFEHVFRKKDAP